MNQPAASDDPLEWLEREQANPHARVEFHQQMAAVKAAFVSTAETVADVIQPVTGAFLEADRPAAAERLRASAAVDHRCQRLEGTCFLLLARQSPVGGDLRRVIALLRSIQDVQRSGNLMAHVARSLDWVHPPALSGEVRETVRQLGDQAFNVFSGAVGAWRTMDGLATVELERADDQVDLLQKVLLTEIYTGRQGVEEAVSLALIARYFERVGDHGVAMARQVTYAVTGQRIRQRGD